VQTFTQVVYIGVLENGALGRRTLEWCSKTWITCNTNHIVCKGGSCFITYLHKKGV